MSLDRHQCWAEEYDGIQTIRGWCKRSVLLQHHSCDSSVVTRVTGAIRGLIRQIRWNEHESIINRINHPVLFNLIIIFDHSTFSMWGLVNFTNSTNEIVCIVSSRSELSAVPYLYCISRRCWKFLRNKVLLFNTKYEVKVPFFSHFFGSIHLVDCVDAHLGGITVSIARFFSIEWKYGRRRYFE